MEKMMDERWSNIKFKEDLFYKIIKKKQVNALALATGEEIEDIKTFFYDRYSNAVRLEFAGLLKIDVPTLWNEFAIEFLLKEVVNRITISDTIFGSFKNSYYQKLVRLLRSGFYNDHFHFVKFFIQQINRPLNIFTGYLLKKAPNHRFIFSSKPFVIAFTTQNNKLFKKETHSSSTDKKSFKFGNIIHRLMIPQKAHANNGGNK